VTATGVETRLTHECLKSRAAHRFFLEDGRVDHDAGLLVRADRRKHAGAVGGVLVHHEALGRAGILGLHPETRHEQVRGAARRPFENGEEVGDGAEVLVDIEAVCTF